MQMKYLLVLLMIAFATLTEVFAGKCTFMCLRQAITCKREKRDFCCENFKKCGLDECGIADLRCGGAGKRGSWNKRFFNDFDAPQEEEDMSLPYF